MFKKTLIALISILILNPSNILAGTGYQGINFVTPFWFGLEMFDQEENSSKVDLNFSVYRLGYTYSSGLYLGLFLDRFKYQSKADADSKYQGYGPSIGFADSGWFFIAHWVLESKKKIHHLGEYTGSGLGIAAGYSVLIGEQISLGTQLTFRANNYDKLVAPTGTSNSKRKESNLLPLIVLGTSFN
ncbi:MAG: hypothetical protein AB8G05_01130 [Oligoflexales bacterium]